MAMRRDWCSCDGKGGLNHNTFTRRTFLASASLAGLWWLQPGTAWAQASVTKRHGNVLVVIFLRGGADGLNIVAPYAEDAYYRARPSLGIAKPKASKPESERLADLDGHFGLNPALSGLYPEFAEGRMAIVHAVGSGDKSHSHFEAMYAMEHGLTNRGDTANGGWLARHLAMTEGSSAPLRAVALSDVMPDSLSGYPNAVAINSLSNYRLRNADPEFRAALESIYDSPASELASAGQATLKVLDTFSKVDPANYQPEHGASYPDSPLGKAMKEVAFLIKTDVGLEVACLDSGGWDSHVTQGSTSGWLTELLKDLGGSVRALVRDLGKEMNRVTVVVQTEFGRRIGENSGLGTDHGAGSVMFAIGGGVQGGKVYGDWPTISSDALSGPGDLAVTTDYRQVLMPILSTWLHNPDARQVFPSFKGKPLQIMKT